MIDSILIGSGAMIDMRRTAWLTVSDPGAMSHVMDQ
jgi:hypothetical protein